MSFRRHFFSDKQKNKNLDLEFAIKQFFGSNSFFEFSEKEIFENSEKKKIKEVYGSLRVLLATWNWYKNVRPRVLKLICNMSKLQSNL